MTPDLIIFDCDGVLVDSEIIAARVESKLLGEAGYKISEEELCERFAGMTFKDILEVIEREANIPISASLIDRLDGILDKRLAREVKAIEGAHEALLAAGKNCCICSNSGDKRLDITLERTKLRPIIGGRVYSALDLDGITPKPAPDIYLHAAKEYNADPANTFVLEDSVHGVKGAKAAGMRVIGFTGASHSYIGHGDALIEAGAQTAINRLADFKDVVSAIAQFGNID